ncbi:multiple coagulation factor deficiency protein 2 homolog isoform X2 [Neodiprion fabricii]|uniref:multiple coagulation factor deficiency protein 2 homolog isoform X2 n=1 Tax=Neodiprion fabricii TaxID=2872261 RepID=UPI001ED8FC4C|nr:multiple coagulation factor deficiency protein 2 homolog isoform X2 [Neodiprion fabricii]
MVRITRKYSIYKLNCTEQFLGNCSTPSTWTPETGNPRIRTAAGSVHREPREASDSRKARQMLLLVLAGLFVEFSVGFRGPHHPKSGISHHHYAPQKDGLKLTQDAELLHDASHLKEDLGALADQLDLSKMSDQELEFYYFNFHDIDNNTKLDGLEILNAILHTLHQHEGDERTEYETARENLEELPRIIDLIDNVLEEDDLDNDGYLGYIEYVLGRQRDENTEAKRDKKLIIP